MATAKTKPQSKTPKAVKAVVVKPQTPVVKAEAPKKVEAKPVVKKATKSTLKVKMAAAEKKKAKADAKALAVEKADAIKKINLKPAVELEKALPAKPSIATVISQPPISPTALSISAPAATPVKREATVFAKFGGSRNTLQPSLEIAKANWLGRK